MKIITMPLLKYALILIIITLFFHFFLSTALDYGYFNYVGIVAIVYGITVFIVAWYFAKKDNEYLPWYDIGFRFHLSTYIIHNVIANIWISGGLNSRYEKISSVADTALYWGLGLVLHFIFFLIVKRRTIKGLKKSEIIE